MSAATQNARILPIAKEHVEGFHRCLDSVARERLYLALVQAPLLDSTRGFVLSNIANDVPQFVAVIDNEVVGWCDICPMKREGFTHCGELGMGVHVRYRRCGIGQQLVVRTIQKAKEKGCVAELRELDEERNRRNSARPKERWIRMFRTADF